MTRFRGFAGILYKEFLQLFRDPTTLFFMLFPPAMEIIAFGYALDLDVRHIATAVCDLDQSRLSREFVQELEATTTFDVVEDVESPRALESAIVQGRVRVGVQIPPDYSSRMQSGEGAQVLVLVDGSDSTFANAAISGANGIGFIRSLEHLQSLAPPGTPVQILDVRPRTLFNPDLRSANFFLPGIIGLIMQVVTVFLTSFAIVRERERGTLEQLLVTPMTKLGLMLGKVTPYFIIMMIELTILIALMRFLFQVPIAGDVAVLFLGSVIFIFSGLAVGLLISTVARSGLQAIQMTMTTIFPSVFFSGVIFPLETMPLIFRAISVFIPLTYYARIMRGVILRGADASALAGDILVLAVMGVTLVLLAATRFRQTVL
jgi:ABC-2 type transport system permease protein